MVASRPKVEPKSANLVILYFGDTEYADIARSVETDNVAGRVVAGDILSENRITR